jgi:hypothetical protein
VIAIDVIKAAKKPVVSRNGSQLIKETIRQIIENYLIIIGSNGVFYICPYQGGFLRDVSGCPIDLSGFSGSTYQPICEMMDEFIFPVRKNRVTIQYLIYGIKLGIKFLESI